MKFPTYCILVLSLPGLLFAQTGDIDTELTGLAQKLGTAIKENGKKKVTVLDFTDLEGQASELGKYIAEQLTVDLVMNRKDFSVLDRANLKSILAEHKLTATGLVDPENAKKLGMFAGVDAIILGTQTPKVHNVVVTAKIITTDTAEIVGAAKAQFRSDETVTNLASKSTIRPVTNSTESPSRDEKPKFVKTLGDFQVELQSLRIVNGMDYLLSLNVTNLNPNKTVYVALECEGPVPGALKSIVEDPEGFQFHSYGEQVTGMSVGCWTFMGWGGAVKKIIPNDAVTASIKFASDPPRGATPGKCHLQLTFLDVTLDGYGKITGVKPRNLMCDLVAALPSTSK